MANIGYASAGTQDPKQQSSLDSLTYQLASQIDRLMETTADYHDVTEKLSQSPQTDSKGGSSVPPDGYIPGHLNHLQYLINRFDSLNDRNRYIVTTLNQYV